MRQDRPTADATPAADSALRLPICRFAALLGVHHSTLIQLAEEDPATYGPAFTDRRGRKWFLGMQAQLALAVESGRLSPDEARARVDAALDEYAAAGAPAPAPAPAAPVAASSVPSDFRLPGVRRSGRRVA